MSDNRFSCGSCGQWLWVWAKYNTDAEESNAVLLDHPDPENMDVRVEGTNSVPKVYCGKCDKRMLLMD